MACTNCNRRPLSCPNQRCGEFRLSTNGIGSSCSSARRIGGCDSPRTCNTSLGPRFMDIGGVVVKYAEGPGNRHFTCPPCNNSECGCPTQVYGPQRNSLCGKLDSMQFCCPDLPCRTKNPYKTCTQETCCRPFPTFPKACCPCCCRPDPGTSKRCFYPQPVCPPSMCTKLCLVPKQCPSPCSCCPAIPVCPPCPPYTHGGCKSCGNKVPLNPPSCIKPEPTGPNPCCPRPPYGIVPCCGKFPDHYCCPKPIVIGLDTPFKMFSTINPQCV